MLGTKQTEGRYLNPLTDYGFKRIFGDKDIMMAFLTDLLNPESPIQDIEFLDKDLVGDTDVQRGVIYDLRCKTEDGSEFIVEMQNSSQDNFSDRILYYLSRSISTQQHKGNVDWRFRLAPVYGIFFLNFQLKGLKPQSIRTIELKVSETGELFSDKMKAYTLELSDYRGKPTEYPKSRIEYWLYNLVNMETMTTALPFQNEQPIFMKMGGISEYAHLNDEERRKYDKSLDDYRTTLSVMDHQRSEGRAEGLAEGQVKGAKNMAIESARKMKQDGMPAELIQKYTGLTSDEIENL